MIVHTKLPLNSNLLFCFIASFAFVLQRHRAKPIPLKRTGSSKGSPFGRAPAIAGERVLFAQLSPLRRLRRHLSQRARLFVSPIITQIGRENKSDIPTSSECDMKAYGFRDILFAIKACNAHIVSAQIPLGVSRIPLLAISLAYICTANAGE